MTARDALFSTLALLWQLAATIGPWCLISLVVSGVLIRFFHIK